MLCRYGVDYLLKSLQKVQSRVARIVAGQNRSISSSEALLHCGWLSVRQLSAYHTLLQVRNVLKNKTPCHLFKMFDQNYTYVTRQASSGAIKCSRKVELDIVKSSFRGRAVELYNNLPEDIRTLESSDAFKEKVKAWVRQTVSV